MGTDAAAVAPFTTMASAMLFATIMFTTTALAVRAHLIGDQKIFEASSNPRSSALDIKSLPSVYTLLSHSSVFGLILFYAYICEYHPPFAHADKHYDADLFFFLTFLLFVVSFFTWKRHDNKKALKAKDTGDVDFPATFNSSARPVAEANDKTEILNRDQTEEWKGWMQFMFLLYHYYHAEEVYNAIRIMITCYVWMTGFGNFSFFYLKADFGFIRVVQMLWRLNFLVLFLCLTQGTTYILYYICLLHSYYFFMVYITMRIGSDRNHTKWWIRIKMAVLGLVIFLIWDCDFGLFKILHYPFFGEKPMQGATGGAMWEWYFRSSLDHWSTYLGMIFALNFPITSLFFRKLEAQTLCKEIFAKGLVGAALLAVFFWWVTGPFLHEKLEYNQTNAFFGFIPLVTYIYFRNLTPWLRNHTLELLHQIGKTTLETYLMQHHIWLTSDAKSLLTLVPGWPKVNFLLVSLLYVFLSRRLYQLTLFLRGMVLPDNRQACLRNLAGMGTAIAFFCFVAYVLDSQNMLNLQSVAIVSVACGILLFQFLVDYSSQRLESPQGRNPVHTSVPYLSGLLLIIGCGLVWHGMAVHGASKILPLPATCQAYANDGQWVPLSGCDEGPNGEEYRKFGISSVSTCSTQNNVLVWGWKQTSSNSHCRFKQRDPKSLKTHLKKRTIYFAGDSETRYMYHAFNRQLGIPDAGAYNATAGRHHDIERKVGDITLNFMWAPIAPDLVKIVKSISETSADGTKKAPDMIVLGGGAWDKLWHYSTEEQKSKLDKAFKNLTAEMQSLRKLGIQVVWMTPTTINTPALGIDNNKKPELINEDEMEYMRSLHRSAGITSSASFVIDGPAFTKSRASEAFDGIHYPHIVYSAGAQILANAMDWLLPDPIVGDLSPPKQPGAMAHASLGLMILGVAFLGIVAFDSFMGFSYLAALIVPDVAPARLYYEAYSDLHRRMGLPPIDGASPTHSPANSRDFDEEEVSGLISKTS